MNQASHFWKPFTPLHEGENSTKVLSGKGAFLFLEDGRSILDGISSWWVNLHGHARREIAEAIFNQAMTLEQVIPAGLTHEPAETLAKKLADILPGDLSQVFFSDDGSTSVEVALKLAVQYWWNQGESQRKKILAFEGAYHGDTLSAMSVGDRETGFTRPFTSLMFDVSRLPFPATWEGDEEISEKEALCLTALDEALEREGKALAAIILEPLIQGAGGMRCCRPEFLKAVEDRARKAGILVIYDEVMTGFGRTGEYFACLKAGVTPDMVCLSKGITGGFLPLGATVTTRKIQASFGGKDPSKTFWHGHSYTANPLACAAAVASFELLKEEAFRPFEAWHHELGEKVRKHPSIEKFRVMGTISAMDLVSEKGGYFDERGPLLRKKFLEAGVLLRPLGNVVYILPPYCMKKEELSWIYDVILDVIDDLLRLGL